MRTAEPEFIRAHQKRHCSSKLPPFKFAIRMIMETDLSNCDNDAVNICLDYKLSDLKFAKDATLLGERPE